MWAQVQNPSAPPPVTTQPSTAPAGQSTASPPPAPAAAKEPDYPDPRTFTLGVFYWLTGPGANPNIGTGHSSLDYETLDGLGKAHRSPGVVASMPITRTGSLHLEVFLTKGDANQIAPATTDVFSTPITKGDYLATRYQVKGAKLYLDDLLYPHRFPVSRLRFKSLWGIEYLGITSSVDEPRYDLANVGQTTFPAAGSKNIILPSFGAAAEYALTKHILFRIDASGFGLYHRADFWDANATLSWRIGHVEVFAGGKELHFKSSPQGSEFFIGTLSGAFVGVSWHL